jgi:hypothetical protein
LATDQLSATLSALFATEYAIVELVEPELLVLMS